eukprot:3895829-Amphidinium_carterae.3
MTNSNTSGEPKTRISSTSGGSSDIALQGETFFPGLGGTSVNAGKNGTCRVVQKRCFNTASHKVTGIESSTSTRAMRLLVSHQAHLARTQALCLSYPSSG